MVGECAASTALCTTSDARLAWFFTEKRRRRVGNLVFKKVKRTKIQAKLALGLALLDWIGLAQRRKLLVHIDNLPFTDKVAVGLGRTLR